MGSFYVNFSVKSTNQSVIRTALQQARRTAMVSPSIDGYTVVYDRGADTQDDAEILAVGTLLSQGVAAPTLAVLNHDDDILYYWLFENGTLTDTYNSNPGYFYGEDEQPTTEMRAVENLCGGLGVPAAARKVYSILSNEEDSALGRHDALVEALQLPAWPLGMGFNYLERGELPSGLSAGDLFRIGQE